MRAVSVFSDLKYFPFLAALINSIEHYGVEARIKVYDFAGLPHLARLVLEPHADLVAAPESAVGEQYPMFSHFRPRVLDAAGVDPYELQVDVDAIVLSDLEEAFREIEAGRLVVLREWDYDHENRNPARQELPQGSVFYDLLEYPEIYRQGLPIYNAGLIGFHKENHSFLLDLWSKTAQDIAPHAKTLVWMEQNKFSLLCASLLKEGRLEVHELPRDLWMQTWDMHRVPQKLVGFEDGRPAVYNGSLDRKMHFYHYTGGIAAAGEIVGEDDKYAVRFQDFVSDVGVPEGVSQEQMQRAWNHVWRERHDSPVGELPRYFYDLGPMRAPRCLDPEWRRHLGRLARHFADLPSADPDSRETWALALAYDYLCLDYRAGELGWLAEPVSLLLGGDVLGEGEKTLSWDAAPSREGDVALSFEPRFDARREWVAARPGPKSRCSEHQRGVHVNIA